MTKVSNLLPFPFCGKTDTLSVTSAAELNCEDDDDFNAWPHSDSYAVMCDASSPGGPGGCGAMGGFAPTESEAVEKWNKRVRRDIPTVDIAPPDFVRGTGGCR